MWQTPLCADEEACIARAVSKRQREFRAGRHCAHRLLTALGVPAQPLLPGRQREPNWPRGVIGSITHTDQAAVAPVCHVAVSTDPSVIGLGIDVESRAPLDPEVHHLICTPRERQWMAAPHQNLDLDLAKLIFSAKECIHKVYFPLNRYTLDFLDAELTLEPACQGFQARIVNPSATETVCVGTLQGRFGYDEHFIYTAIVLRKEPPP